MKRPIDGGQASWCISGFEIVFLGLFFEDAKTPHESKIFYVSRSPWDSNDGDDDRASVNKPPRDSDDQIILADGLTLKIKNVLIFGIPQKLQRSKKVTKIVSFLQILILTIGFPKIQI